MDFKANLEFKRPATAEEIRHLLDRLIERGETRKVAAYIVEHALIFVLPWSPIERAGLGEGVVTILWAIFPSVWLHRRPLGANANAYHVVCLPVPFDRSHGMEGELHKDKDGHEFLIFRRPDAPADGTAKLAVAGPGSN